MGRKVEARRLAFVTLEPVAEGFRGGLRIQDVQAIDADLQTLLAKAAKVYAKAVSRTSRLLKKIGERRSKRQRIPARLVWDVGDSVFLLKAALQRRSLQLDDMYAHLTRDLEVKRKWLEKAIILRRYIPDREMIPDGLNWGRLEKGTRRNARKLVGARR